MMIEIRTTGDVVSACAGGKKIQTICSIEYPKNMGVGASHHLNFFDFDPEHPLTWNEMDMDNYFHFVPMYGWTDANFTRNTCTFLIKFCRRQSNSIFPILLFASFEEKPND